MERWLSGFEYYSLPKDQLLIHNTDIQANNRLQIQFQKIWHLTQLPRALGIYMVTRHACRQNTCTHKLNFKLTNTHTHTHWKVKNYGTDLGNATWFISETNVWAQLLWFQYQRPPSISCCNLILNVVPLREGVSREIGSPWLMSGIYDLYKEVWGGLWTPSTCEITAARL